MSRLARTTPLLFVFLWSVVAPASATAQNAAVESPAHISVVDGAALLERDGRSESAPASMPLLAGDRVRTQNGRVEILFNDGSTLHLDTNSTVDFQSDEVSPPPRRPHPPQHRQFRRRESEHGLPRRCTVGMGADCEAR